MIDLQFPNPKDPADVAWYQLRFREPLTAVSAITATPSGTAGSGGPHTTPGDSLAGGDLVPASWGISSDTFGAIFRLSGGVPGHSYAVRADVTTADGSTLSRSAILEVTGQ